MAAMRRATVITIVVICSTIIFFSRFYPNVPIATLLRTTQLPQTVPLYVFGDSLYDTGMALYIDKGPAANGYPYGKTYFKRPAGRFSDGRIIPDFIAEFANLPFPVPYPKPYFTDYSKAVNFADAGAEVLVEGRPNTLNFKSQTDYYIEMVSKLEQQYGINKAQKLVSRAVHMINIGANDYVDVWKQTPKPLNSTFKNYFINKILGNFTIQITRMHNQGARKFAFHSYGPMGCLPAFLQPNGSCSEDLNDLAKLHNHKFGELVKTWARQLPGFKYTIYDFYTSVSRRVANGSKYGFTETQTACCGGGPFRGAFTCMEEGNFTLCDDPTTYLWFDAGHPTEKAYLQFAREFWNGTSNLVSPYTLQTLFRGQDTISI